MASSQILPQAAHRQDEEDSIFVLSLTLDRHRELAGTLYSVCKGLTAAVASGCSTVSISSGGGEQAAADLVLN